MHSYKAITLRNFTSIPQIALNLSEREKFEIMVVGHVLPFKTNRYIIENLIDWNQFRNDPIYVLNFPRKELLLDQHFEEMAQALTSGAGKAELRLVASKIRRELNPNPAGQMEKNVPQFEEEKLTGIQHKYRETMLFFPSQGQTCHAFCTFCFRWPQFTGIKDLKFGMKDIQRAIRYLSANPDVTDILFTGGDPLIMRTKILSQYLNALIAADLPGLQSIRLGSKALSYWPHRFVHDEDADELLHLMEKVVKSGINLALMAHINHPRELQTDIVQEAFRRVIGTGTVIRTQSPIMRNINDDSATWAELWQKQVQLGCIPYYMFIARDTGAQHYFAVTLARSWEIYKEAIQRVSGLARTARGPSMSADPGKVQVLGVTKVHGEKVFVLQFLQGRKAKWVHRPFFAKFDPAAIWLDDLSPAFDDKTFFFKNDHPLTQTNVPLEVNRSSSVDIDLSTIYH